MRAAPAALATVLALSGIRTVVGAEPCPPRATLDGDKLAVERVALELQRLGVKVTSDDGGGGGGGGGGDVDGGGGRCVVVRAQVALEDSGRIAVAVHGATRGSEGRVVSDAALAAAWIDSWTRSDLDSALWAVPPTSTTVAATTGAPGASRPAASRSVGAGAARMASTAMRAPETDVENAETDAGVSMSRWDQLAFAVDYEQTWSDDDASWRGVTGSVCVMAGGFCIGTRVRAAFDPTRLYNSTAVARSDLSMLATASRPVAVGRMTIAPELGLGVGRLATRRAEESCKPVMPMECNPMDPNCAPPANTGMCDPTDPGTGTTAPKVYVGDNFTAATYAPRIALALRVALPLFEHVWLDGLAGFTYAPFSHGAELATDDPTGMNTAGSLFALPGEPSSGYVIGVGLRVGAK